MLVSFASVGLNLALNYTFMFHLDLGHRGLALSTTICATLNFAVLYFLMMGPAKNSRAGSLQERSCVVQPPLFPWLWFAMRSSQKCHGFFPIKVPFFNPRSLQRG